MIMRMARVVGRGIMEGRRVKEWWEKWVVMKKVLELGL